MSEKGRWNGLPLVIFGSGGISREVAKLIEDINSQLNVPIYELLGYVSKAEDEVGLVHSGYKVITCDNNFISFASSYSLLGVVIPQGFPRIKEEIFKNIKDISSLVFPNIIHPSVIMKRDSIALGIGNVIAANVVMTLDIEIGDFNLINSSVTIGHDVRISNYCVINPLVSISGNVVLEDRVLVGTGASVLQNVVIGRNSTIGIGSAVIKNVPDFSTAIGVPAKIIKKL